MKCGWAWGVGWAVWMRLNDDAQAVRRAASGKRAGQAGDADARPRVERKREEMLAWSL